MGLTNQQQQQQIEIKMATNYDIVCGCCASGLEEDENMGACLCGDNSIICQECGTWDDAAGEWVCGKGKCILSTQTFKIKVKKVKKVKKPEPEPEPEPLPKCDECDCDLTEDDEKYWCNSRGEYICHECLDGAEKCDDEGCDCCGSFADAEDETEFVCEKCSTEQGVNNCELCNASNVCEECHGQGGDHGPNEIWVCHDCLPFCLECKSKLSSSRDECCGKGRSDVKPKQKYKCLTARYEPREQYFTIPAEWEQEDISIKNGELFYKGERQVVPTDEYQGGDYVNLFVDDDDK